MDLATTPALILAGGRGTRLRTVLADRPKVLAPVNGRPFVTYLLDRLDTAGVREVVLLTGYQAEQVREELGDTHGSLRLRYSAETTELGTGGAIRNALPMLDAPRFFVLNGDSCCDVVLQALVGRYLRRRAHASLALVHAEDTARFGRVRINGAGWVQGFEEKQAAAGSGWINAGVYLFDRAAGSEIPSGVNVSLERDVFPRLASEGRLLGHPTAGEFLDIGTPESYERAERFLCAEDPVAASC